MKLLTSFQVFCVLGVLCSQATLLMSLQIPLERNIRKLVVESREVATTASPFVCPGNGSYPVPGKECTGVYYSCASGSPVLTECNGASSVFDPSSGSCVSASIAQCKKNSTTSTVTPSTTTTTQETILTDSTSASSEITTILSSTTITSTTEMETPSSTTITSTTEMETPSSTTITPPISSSTTKPTSSTTITSTISSSTTNPTSSTTGTSTPFTCSTSDGMFPNPNNCNTFYICSNGNPNLFNCPSNLVYNPVLQYCDYPSNVPSCKSV